MAAMDRRIVTLISASALLAVIVAVVLIAGGSDDSSSSSADLTDTTVKPTIEAPGDPAPTELVINDIVEGRPPRPPKVPEAPMDSTGAPPSGSAPGTSTDPAAVV